jgi:kynurenine formamidase
MYHQAMLIDISVELNENTPVYPGDPKTRIKPAGVLENDGYTDHVVTLATHVGTHIDAPAHMVEGGKTLGTFPLDRFVGRGVYVDVRGGFDIDAFRKTDILEGDIVLLHTGWSDRYADPAYYTDFDQIPVDIAHFLVERKISMLGMDMSGPDHEPFPVHKILLGGNVLIIENLTGLAALAGKNFTVYALPLRLDIDGSPARVVCQLN